MACMAALAAPGTWGRRGGLLGHFGGNLGGFFGDVALLDGLMGWWETRLRMLCREGVYCIDWVVALGGSLGDLGGLG